MTLAAWWWWEGVASQSVNWWEILHWCVISLLATPGCWRYRNGEGRQDSVRPALDWSTCGQQPWCIAYHYMRRWTVTIVRKIRAGKKRPKDKSTKCIEKNRLRNRYATTDIPEKLVNIARFLAERVWCWIHSALPGLRDASLFFVMQWCQEVERARAQRLARVWFLADLILYGQTSTLSLVPFPGRFRQKRYLTLRDGVSETARRRYGFTRHPKSRLPIACCDNMSHDE